MEWILCNSQFTIPFLFLVHKAKRKIPSLIIDLQIAVWLRLEVTLVVVVYAYEPIFTSRCITLSRRVDRQPKLGQKRGQYVDDGRSYLVDKFHEIPGLRAREGGVRMKKKLTY